MFNQTLPDSQHLSFKVPQVSWKLRKSRHSSLIDWEADLKTWDLLLASLLQIITNENVTCQHLPLVLVDTPHRDARDEWGLIFGLYQGHKAIVSMKSVYLTLGKIFRFSKSQFASLWSVLHDKSIYFKTVIMKINTEIWHIVQPL